MRSEAHVHIGRARKGLKDCISVRDLPSGRTRHASVLFLDEATFAVQPAGNRKFQREGVKNVHAFVRGRNTLEFSMSQPTLDPAEHGWKRAGYNPARNTTFVDESGRPLHRAAFAMLIGKQLWYR